MSVTSKTIKINDLLVNTENFRFDPVAGQKEAIQKMLNDQKDKLFNLAEHIIENGLDPTSKTQVSLFSEDKTKYYILEGNRRIVTLKILNNPDLIDSEEHINLRKKFRKLHDDNKTKIIRELDCLVFADPADANKWIKLKHTGANDGVGTVDWNGQQVERFNERVEGKSSVALQIIKKLQTSEGVPNKIREQVSNIKITNLDRLISDPDVRNMLCIEINSGILQSIVEEKEVIKGLVQVAKDLLDPKFNVNAIYHKQDRKEYISKFPKASRPNERKKADKPWVVGGGAVTIETTKPTKKRVNPKDRKNLIPRACVIKIENVKVNKIYHELRKLDVFKYTHAVSVLMRVFIELSIDCYREDNGLAKKRSSGDDSENFQQKVFQVVDQLRDKEGVDKVITQGIRTAVKDNNSILGIAVWHAYVHNNKFSPTPENLITTWDNIQKFMEIVWEHIE